MQSYKDFTQYFGTALTNPTFQAFLQRTFDDLSDYNVAKGDYIISKASGIEIGFTNMEAVFDDDEGAVFEQGNPIFSHVNIYPKALSIEMPFEVSFSDERRQVLQKAGQPTQTKQGEASFLGSAYLVDNYKKGDIIVSFDYEPKQGTINFVQIRDNNIVEHLKI